LALDTLATDKGLASDAAVATVDAPTSTADPESEDCPPSDPELTCTGGCPSTADPESDEDPALMPDPESDEGPAFTPDPESDEGPAFTPDPESDGSASDGGW
jgi:hypothetical protein